jgi:hypothetical protein
MYTSRKELNPKEKGFIWENYYPDSEILLHVNGVLSRYDCYNFKILKPTKYQTTLINVSPRLEIFTKVDTFFIGQVSYDYHIFPNEEPLEDIILDVLQSAHLEFIQYFEGREGTTVINKFKPSIEFKWQGLTEQIRLSIHKTH